MVQAIRAMSGGGGEEIRSGGRGSGDGGGC